MFLFVKCLEGFFLIFLNLFFLQETTWPNCIYWFGVTIFIGVPNVEFNQSVLFDNIASFVIILPHNE